MCARDGPAASRAATGVLHLLACWCWRCAYGSGSCLTCHTMRHGAATASSARLPAWRRRPGWRRCRRPEATAYWALHDCSHTLPAAQHEMRWGKPGVSTAAGHQRKLRLCISLQALTGNVRSLAEALQRLTGLPSGSKHCLRSNVGKTYKKRARHAHMGGMHPVAAHCVISSGATGAMPLGR